MCVCVILFMSEFFFCHGPRDDIQDGFYDHQNGSAYPVQVLDYVAVVGSTVTMESEHQTPQCISLSEGIWKQNGLWAEKNLSYQRLAVKQQLRLPAHLM